MSKLTLCLIPLGLFCSCMTGCRDRLAPGHYEGTLFWSAYSENTGNRVSIDIFSGNSTHTVGDKEQERIEITGQSGAVITSISISNISSNQFDFEIPAVYPQPFHLKKVTPTTDDKTFICYQSQELWVAELCFDDVRFQLRIFDQNRIGVFKLHGDAFSKEPDFVLEAPVQLSLDQAIKRALEANLDSRIGFEHVIQANYAVTAAYLNLIPHLSSNLIWNIQPSYIGAIATVQALAPFLLPTYWLQAKESQYDLKIKKDAQTILKAGLAAMVEQLSYAYDRDQQIMLLQERTLNTLDRFINPQFADALMPLLRKLRADKDKTQDLIREERYTISQALGFHNPEAVQKNYCTSLRTCVST